MLTIHYQENNPTNRKEVSMKCAIYTRVSTSMQAEKEYNSCEAQKDKILSFVKSQDDLEVHKEYSDPGFSGSNLNRPALKELLKDIAEKKVQSVLTYKIDRLTRSSKDFYSLIEFFEKYGVSFVSVTERFDTSSPAGRLLRNIMLTFAQFEREMIAERTRDKMIQRAEKGMWNGGKIPFGYKFVEKKLLVSKKEAEIVQKIFEQFVMTGSLKKTLNLAKENGWINSKYNKPITSNGVFYILRNPVYAGQMVWAKKIYASNHEPIISKELFNHAQSLTKEKIRKKLLYKEFFLKGLIKCGECASTMTPCFTNKKKRRYYYYKCVKVQKEGFHVCSIKEVNAEKIESFLIENLSRISQDRQYIGNLAFKMAHALPHPRGVELSEEVEKNLYTSVSQVLINFKKRIGTATQVEKCLVFRETIQALKLSKESLEVIIFIKDTSDWAVEDFLTGQAGRVAAKMREGVLNPDAPADTTGSLPKIGSPNGSRTHVLTVRG